MQQEDGRGGEDDKHESETRGRRSTNATTRKKGKRRRNKLIKIHVRGKDKNIYITSSQEIT